MDPKRNRFGLTSRSTLILRRSKRESSLELCYPNAADTCISDRMATKRDSPSGGAEFARLSCSEVGRMLRGPVISASFLPAAAFYFETIVRCARSPTNASLKWDMPSNTPARNDSPYHSERLKRSWYSRARTLKKYPILVGERAPERANHVLAFDCIRSRLSPSVGCACPAKLLSSLFVWHSKNGISDSSVTRVEGSENESFIGNQTTTAKVLKTLMNYL